MAWTERTKPTDVATERADVGGPGYDFSMTNIFWDRTDIYFDSTTTGPTQRTKPTDSATQRTKPTDTTTERTKETDTWTERTKETQELL